MLGRQMIGAVREMPEHIEHIEDVAKEDEQVEEMDIEHIKRKSKVNLDGSYDIYEDVQFKEIMEKQRDIASDLKVNLDEVQSSLKKSKVDETLSRLQALKSKIQRDEKEMKKMIEKDIRYSEYYRNEQEIVLSCDNESSNDDDNWIPKMDDKFKFFYQMMKNIESLPGNDFKKGAQLELEKMNDIAFEMKENREDELGMKF